MSFLKVCTASALPPKCGGFDAPAPLLTRVPCAGINLLNNQTVAIKFVRGLTSRHAGRPLIFCSWLLGTAESRGTPVER